MKEAAEAASEERATQAAWNLRKTVRESLALLRQSWAERGVPEDKEVVEAAERAIATLSAETGDEEVGK